jgi:hypothetical protein
MTQALDAVIQKKLNVIELMIDTIKSSKFVFD